MELQQLRYVKAVAETGNFTRASERCNVAQPSLSQQVINLEKELGHKLFHRLGRRAVLTEAGKVFLERVKRVLSEVDDASREMNDSASLERSITIGAIPTLAPTLLPPVIALCRRNYPHLSIRIREDFRENLIWAVREGELDLALVSMPVKDPLMQTEVLFEEPLLLVIGKNHPLASKSKIDVDQIKNEPFVMLGAGSTMALEIQRFCGDHQIDPIVACRCAQITTVKAYVALGCGITILPKSSLSPDDRTSLIVKQLEKRAPTREIAVVRHMQRYQSKGAEQFLTLLRNHLKKPALAPSV